MNAPISVFHTPKQSRRLGAQLSFLNKQLRLKARLTLLVEIFFILFLILNLSLTERLDFSSTLISFNKSQFIAQYFDFPFYFFLFFAAHLLFLPSKIEPLSLLAVKANSLQKFLAFFCASARLFLFTSFICCWVASISAFTSSRFHSRSPIFRVSLILKIFLWIK